MLESSVGGTPRKKRKKKPWEEHWLALMSPSCPTLVVPTTPTNNRSRKGLGMGVGVGVVGPSPPTPLACFISYWALTCPKKWVSF